MIRINRESSILVFEHTLSILIFEMSLKGEIS